MAGCEVKIEDIAVNPDCPSNEERVLFTRPDGLSEMRLWAKVKECLNNGLLQRADIKFRIGDGGPYTPAVGSREYLNPNLAGKRYRVFRRGVGYLEEGREFQIFTVGGFQLLLQNDVFDENEVFHVQEYETIVQANDGGFLKNIGSITGDITLTNLDANTLFEVAGGNNRVKINLPVLSTVNPFTLWGFTTSGYNRFQVAIEAPSASIVFRRRNRTRVILGQDEYFILIAGTDAWHVFSSYTNYPYIGRPDFDYIVRPNTVIAEGQIASRIDHLRVVEFLEEFPSAAVTEIVWQSSPVLQRQLFSLGDGFTTFRFPDLRGLHFRSLDRGRGLDTDTPGTSLPGRYQADENRKHSHESEQFSDRGWPDGSGDRNQEQYFIHRNRDSQWRRLAISEAGGSESRGKNVGLYGIINT